jgi:hypothetical protein
LHISCFDLGDVVEEGMDGFRAGPRGHVQLAKDKREGDRWPYGYDQAEYEQANKGGSRREGPRAPSSGSMAEEVVSSDS